MSSDEEITKICEKENEELKQQILESSKKIRLMKRQLSKNMEVLKTVRGNIYQKRYKDKKQYKEGQTQ